MDFGKKTERLRVAVSVDVAREIRAMADLDCRELQDQVRFILMRGLEHLRGNRGNGYVEERASVSGHAGPARTFAENEAKDFRGQPVTFGAKPPVRVGSPGRKRGVA